MKLCSTLHPLLSRVGEGEATPDEALRVARHVSGCTGCRILLAREKRLGQVLDDLQDILPYEEGLLRGIMSALPEEPPKEAWMRARRRGLKLVGSAGLFLLAAATIHKAIELAGGGGSLPSWSLPDLEGAGQFLERIPGLVRLALLLAGQVLSARVLEPAVLASASLGRMPALLWADGLVLGVPVIAAVSWAVLRRRRKTGERSARRVVETVP